MTKAGYGKLAVFMGPGNPWEIREYPIPKPEPGAILGKVTLAGLCGSDLHDWRGDRAYQGIPEGGRIQGHEWAGTIDTLGEGVTADSLGNPIKPGDRIVSNQVVGCGACKNCLNGDPNICGIRMRAYNTPGNSPETPPHFTGTFGDYFYIRPNQLVFKVPDALTDEMIVPVNCAYGTVYQGLLNGEIKGGDSVVVMGAGGLGLAAIAFARDMGAGKIIAVDKLANRLELAKEFGADETIDASQYESSESRIERVWELTDNRGADLALELVGMSSILPECLRMTRFGGTSVEIGNVVIGRPVMIDPFDFIPERKIVGSWMYKPSVIPKILDLLVRTQTTFPWHKLVSHRFKLTDITNAFKAAEWDGRDQVAVTRACLEP